MTAPTIDTVTGTSFILGGAGPQTFTQSTTVTNCVIIVATWCENNGSVCPAITSITGGGLTFANRSINSSPSGLGRGEIWWAYCPSIVTNQTFTLNVGSVDILGIINFSVAGCNQTNPWDSNGGLPAYQSVGGGAWTPSITASTSESDDLLLFFVGADANFSAGTTPASGFTHIQDFSAGYHGFADHTIAGQAVTGVQSGVTYTWGSSLTPVRSGEAIFDALTADAPAIDLPGAEATTAAGSPMYSSTVPMSGAGATASPGSMAFHNDANIPLIGAAAGTMGGTIVVQLTEVGAPTASSPTYSQEDYTNAFLDLLPSGRAWRKFPQSDLYQTVEALIGSYSRDIPSPIGSGASAGGSSPRAMQLLRDTMPVWSALGAGAVVEFLPEWQLTLGLPDPCLGDTPSIEQEVEQCVARFVSLGGQSIPFYVSYAANLGFTITITEYAPFRADISDADTPLYDDSDWYVWQVNSQNTSAWLFKADINAADEKLGGFANDVLECEIRRIAPAHTIPIFTYTVEIDAPIMVIGAAANTAAGGMAILGNPLLTGSAGSSAPGSIVPGILIPVPGSAGSTAAGTITV